jgi:hypothetical protein
MSLRNTNFCTPDGGKIRIRSIRKEFGLPTKAPISPDELQRIYVKYRTDDKMLCIIDDMFDGKPDDRFVYLWYKKGHYRVVKSMKRRKVAVDKKKRGLLAFDFETRNTNVCDFIGEQEARQLRDTICQIVYKPSRSTTVYTRCFTTNAQKTSARQFLDFLHEQHVKNKHFTCIAHNGANFDMYLLMKDMTENEIYHAEIQRRGTSIISANIFDHVFKDTACFMPASLNYLCSSFKISDENKKLKSFEIPVHAEGDEAPTMKTLSNMEMCFYKPELSFDEFMQLEKKEPEFWHLYKKYCENDSRALLELYEKFQTAYNEVVIEMGNGTNKLLKQGCTLNSKNTIGGLAKKLLEATLKNNKYYKKYKKFLQEDDDVPEGEYPKYNFLTKCKRGGISHCHQPGRHDHRVASVDVCSEYPACMLWMQIPTGESRWVHSYNKKWHGFYHLRNVQFSGPKGRFLPVCAVPEKGQSLRWSEQTLRELYVDSDMIAYLYAHCGLQSFDVVKGLVSDQSVRGTLLFAKYVKPLFHAKKLQDKYKKENDPRYNPAFRSCVKLFLNSLTGKLIESSEKYFHMKYVQGNVEAADIKGVQYVKEFNNARPNHFVVAGCMIYSYSKRLLYEYVRCLPTPIIHTETDSLYFHHDSLQEFTENVKQYNGYYPVAFGDELGNIKLEHLSVGSSYFLGKKFYYLECEYDGEIARIKGIPLSTISESGSKVPLVTKKMYEKVFQGEAVIKKFASIRRTLNGDTRLTAYVQHRTVKPIMKYPVYA